ncbi:MAG: hypothetical protein VW397_01595 [Candidatus Margulisiibacteriota bacterium]
MSAEHITNQTHLKETNDRALNQELNTISRELRNETQTLNKVPKIESNNLIETNTVQRLLSQQSEVAKQQITKKSFEKLHESNHAFNEGLEDALEQEINRFFNPNPKVSQDEVLLSDRYKQDDSEASDQLQRNQTANYAASKSAKKSSKERIEKSNNFWVEDEKDSDDMNDKVHIKTKETSKDEKVSSRQSHPQMGNKDLKEFATMMSKYAMSQDPNTKHLIDKKRNELLKRGISNAQLNFATGKVGLLIKQHYLYDIKQKLINYHMVKGFSKQERAERNFSFNNSSNQLMALKNNGRLAGDLSESIEKLRFQAKQELGHFLYQESVNQFTKQALGQISLQKFTEELVKLQKAAQSAGVEISEKELTDKICGAIDNLGLTQFHAPTDNNEESQQQPPEPIMTQEEMLDDKLRYLYMMKALHPSLRQKVDVFFKMKKCKNGMIKLGIYTEEKEDQLKKQGEFLASKQFIEELHFVFREEATLPFLSGPEYGVIRKKKAFFLGQLRKLNHGLSNDEINRIKESMYREMYGLIKEEVMQLEQMAEIHKHISITRQLKKYKEVITRINEEVVLNDHQDVLSKLSAPYERSTINEGA